VSSDAFAGDLRIMIVTDVRLDREGLTQMLAGQTGLTVVGHTSPRDASLGEMALLKPDVVLIDSGLVIRTDICRRVTIISAGTHVVAFAVEEENDNEVLTCARAGVVGFVAREASADYLVHAILTARTGHASCSPRATANWPLGEPGYAVDRSRRRQRREQA
jgi:DNA-binding NarL/FixJ family response regulator